MMITNYIILYNTIYISIVSINGYISIVSINSQLDWDY